MRFPTCGELSDYIRDHGGPKRRDFPRGKAGRALWWTACMEFCKPLFREAR